MDYQIASNASKSESFFDDFAWRLLHIQSEIMGKLSVMMFFLFSQIFSLWLGMCVMWHFSYVNVQERITKKQNAVENALKDYRLVSWNYVSGKIILCRYFTSLWHWSDILSERQSSPKKTLRYQEFGVTIRFSMQGGISGPNFWGGGK